MILKMMQDFDDFEKNSEILTILKIMLDSVILKVMLEF